MVIVYALYDKGLKQIYVGMTNNLERRLHQHQRGESLYTRQFSDFVVIYTESCEGYGDGRKREKYLKSGFGKKFLKTLIR